MNVDGQTERPVELSVSRPGLPPVGDQLSLGIELLNPAPVDDDDLILRRDGDTRGRNELVRSRRRLFPGIFDRAFRGADDDTVVPGIRHIDVAGAVDRDPEWGRELAGLCAGLSPLGHENPFLRELEDGVELGVRDITVSPPVDGYPRGLLQGSEFPSIGGPGDLPAPFRGVFLHLELAFVGDIEITLPVKGDGFGQLEDIGPAPAHLDPGRIVHGSESGPDFYRVCSRGNLEALLVISPTRFLQGYYVRTEGDIGQVTVGDLTRILSVDDHLRSRRYRAEQHRPADGLEDDFLPGSWAERGTMSSV